MKTYFILFILLCISSLYAQNAHSKITYICHTTIGQADGFNGVNTLYFDERKGLYIHNNYPKEMIIEGDMFTMKIIKGDPEGLPVFMNLEEQYLYFKTTYGSRGKDKNFMLREDLPKIDWQIQPETRKIERFNCLKAIGVFGGRTYDVWFTPDIPVSLGPYKLWGLPGMILEAKSRDGYVSYEFKSYESPTADTVKLEKPSQGKEISWEDFKTHVINKLLSVESLSTDRVTATNNDPPQDYYIERNQFTIISEYKKQRAAKQNKN